MELRAKMRKIDLITEIDPLISEKFVTDPRRIKQILINLVGNSMKFTFQGYIKVIAKRKKIKGRNCVNISVVDTGVGIKKENLKKLFKLFTKIDRTS